MGAKSPPLDVEFGKVPDKLEDMKGTITRSRLCITWALPGSDSPPVSGYKIEIEDSDGTYRTLPLSVCGLDPLETECCVSTTKLSGPPISLEEDDDIQIRGIPFNPFGDGPPTYVYPRPKMCLPPKKIGKFEITREETGHLNMRWPAIDIEG